MTSRQIDAGRAAFTLDLTDKLSAKLKKMEKRIASSVERVNSIGDSVAGIGARVAGVGAAVTAFGGVALGGFAKATSAAGDFAETLSKFEAVFGDQSNAIRTWAKDLAKQVGRSEAELLKFLGDAGDVFIPLGFNPREAAEFSKTLTKLAIDLGSFNNLADGEAFDRLLSAVVGNTENLRAFGVVAGDAQIKAEALAQGFDPKNLTPYQKSLAIVQLALKGTAAAQGDAVKTAGSYNNRIKALSAAFDDLVKTIGKPLLDPAPQFAATMKTIVDKVNAFAEENADLVKRLGMLAVGVTAAGAAIVALGGTLIGVGIGLKAAAIAVGGITVAISGIAAVAGVAFAAVTSPVALLTAGATAGVVALAKMSGSLDGLLAGTKGLSRGISSAVGRIRQSLEDGGIATAINQLKIELSRVGEISSTALSLAWAKAFDFVKRVGEQTATNLSAAFTAATASIADSISILVAGLADALSALNEQLNSYSARAVAGAVKKSFGDGLVGDVIGNAVESAFRGKVAVETPIADFGNDISARVNKLSEDLKANAAEFQNALSGTVDSNQKTRENQITKLADRLRELQQTPVEIVVDTNTVLTKLNRAFETIRGKISKLFADPSGSPNVSNVDAKPPGEQNDGKTLTSASSEIAANAASFAPTIDDNVDKQILAEERKQTEQGKTLAAKLETAVGKVGEIAGTQIANASAGVSEALRGLVDRIQTTTIEFAGGPEAQHAFRFLDELALPPLELARGLDFDGAIALEGGASEDTLQEAAKSLANIDRKIGKKARFN